MAMKENLTLHTDESWEQHQHKREQCVGKKSVCRPQQSEARTADKRRYEPTVSGGQKHQHRISGIYKVIV